MLGNPPQHVSNLVICVGSGCICLLGVWLAFQTQPPTPLRHEAGRNANSRMDQPDHLKNNGKDAKQSHAPSKTLVQHLDLSDLSPEEKAILNELPPICISDLPEMPVQSTVDHSRFSHQDRPSNRAPNKPAPNHRAQNRIRQPSPGRERQYRPRLVPVRRSSPKISPGIQRLNTPLVNGTI